MGTQLSFDLPAPVATKKRGRGGARPGAGRKKKSTKDGYVPHVPRPSLNSHTPVHVTMRAERPVPDLRSELLFHFLSDELRAANGDVFRVLQFSVQTDHVHLIVEARDKRRLWRAIQRLASRLARGLNQRSGRSGSVFRHRYHRRDLTSPRQVRNAFVYVLFNIRKHDTKPGHHEVWMTVLDPCSSAPWFDGFDPRAGPRLRTGLLRGWSRNVERSPVTAPRSWLARAGWKKHGLIAATEQPKSPA